MPASLRDVAIDIWKAGVAAVDSEHLVRQNLSLGDGCLRIADLSFPSTQFDRVVVAGAGKAGAGMAAAVETVFEQAGLLERLCGQVNVPADCVRPLSRITLHPARPAGVNEPTREGVAGAERILELVSGLTRDDLCLVLLSGGGSALLPAPIAGVSLEDKQMVTRLLMDGGATIHELNCVRKQLSRIKGGGLARAASAGTLISLIISDVIGDPLDVIASGPTVPDSTTPQQALDILQRVVTQPDRIPAAVIDALNRTREQPAPAPGFSVHVANRIIGSNALAVAAAEERARQWGFSVESLGSAIDGIASDVGRNLAARVRQLQTAGRLPGCLISGGEPTVRLARTDRPRRGGRNQEVALGACAAFRDQPATGPMAILSGGTDGEDGPTDAAGALCDAGVLEEMRRQNLEPAEFLAINNSYEFFERTGGLLRTGPTHTNVMDLHVALAGTPATSLFDAD